MSNCGSHFRIEDLMIYLIIFFGGIIDLKYLLNKDSKFGEKLRFIFCWDLYSEKTRKYFFECSSPLNKLFIKILIGIGFFGIIITLLSPIWESFKKINDILFGILFFTVLFGIIIIHINGIILEVKDLKKENNSLKESIKKLPFFHKLLGILIILFIVGFLRGLIEEITGI